jgi:hypothetical protein
MIALFNPHFFTFYTKVDKPIKDVIMHLPGNTSPEDITAVLQEIDYDVISQTSYSRKGEGTHTSLLLSPVTLARNQKDPEIFKLTTLCNIVIKADACKSQNELTQCYKCLRFGHIWMHWRHPPRSLWCGGGHCHRECPEDVGDMFLRNIG